jgi:hypothetical protein
MYTDHRGVGPPSADAKSYELSKTEREELDALRHEYGNITIKGSDGGCITPEAPGIVLLADNDPRYAQRPLKDYEQREIRKFFERVLSARSLRTAK